MIQNEWVTMTRNPIFYLKDPSDVDLIGVADQNFFYYDATTGLWKSRSRN